MKLARGSAAEQLKPGDATQAAKFRLAMLQVLEVSDPRLRCAIVIAGAKAAGLPALLEPKTPKTTRLELKELDLPRMCTLAET